MSINVSQRHNAISINVILPSTLIQLQKAI